MNKLYFCAITNLIFIDLKDEINGFLAAPTIWDSNTIFFGLHAFELPKKSVNFNDLSRLENQIKDIYVLGKRVERFFEFQILNSKIFDLRISNLQIFEDKKTLGELDFILKEKDTNQSIHVELVYKFYVYDPSYKNELSRWIGPNRRDSLLEKIDKLKSKQLPLLYKKRTQDILNGKYIPTKNIIQKVCYKASLFVPKNLLGSTFPKINNDCIKGYYITLKEFASNKYETKYFYSPQKQFWPVDPIKNEAWFSYQEILPQIKKFIKNKKAPLVWMKTDKGIEQFFVVWW
ncbi:DUF1853 family protein [Zunongwangia sp. HGR-M22]|uniref:DUF1853 family protein n=1 Tax=Zunongwangia sp. HGR-M22 TaxID=3015168 RepID=UPI0022DD4EEC|nr:DUF1853 family protein [Zunongwangia sp. HGR-M22]WBL24337.1 DUF1853 family protein [Zunongwangia sp. HGR-M22]